MYTVAKKGLVFGNVLFAILFRKSEIGENYIAYLSLFTVDLSNLGLKFASAYLVIMGV